ncbi:MAG: hypothetical protein E3K37_12085 [Candidatus Kuenenia sp.]|nr:hypothetical protein [Candidatus Kuenenia hertensis]
MKNDVIILLYYPKIAVLKKIVIAPTLEIACQGRMKRIIAELSSIEKVLEVIKQF